MEYITQQDSMAQVAQSIFGIPALYPWQRLVIANILECAVSLSSHESEQQEDDSFNKGKQVVLLPTGAGKSLCFMVPAVLLEGITLIIYPLLALMADQLRRIEKAGLDAVLFRGGQSQKERKDAFEKLKNGTKIILANPEILQSNSILEKLSEFSIIHVAIDEAHCVSEWGDTFRPSYLELGKIIQKLKIPVVTAFTATASSPVLHRMTEILFNGQAPYLMKSTSDRQNIHYSVQYSHIKEKTALLLAQKEKRPMIIFCGTRAKSEKTARFFREIFHSNEVKFYHAGLTKEEKTATENWFFPHKTGILCCTCAFGMGIDKSDIRTVIHLEVSPTPEAYIQEAGRGGRDGHKTRAIVLWNDEDEEKFLSYKKNQRERFLALFAQGTMCRRHALLTALGDSAVCSGCDFCDAQSQGKILNTRIQDIEQCIHFIKKHSGQWTIREMAEKLKKNENKKIPIAIYEAQDFLEIIHFLLNKKKIKMIGLKTKKVAVNKKNLI